MFLGEIADLATVPGFDRARVGLLGPGQHAQQRGLAGAVEAQNHHPRATVDGQVDAGEHLQ